MTGHTTNGIPIVGGTIDNSLIAKLDTQPLNSVTWVHHTKVISNDYNMNKVAESEMKLLAISILQDGFTMPVVCIYEADQDLYILIDGFHRTSTVKNNKEVNAMTGGYVPVVVLNKTTPEQARQYRIVDNKTQEITEWESDKLALEITEIGTWDTAMDLFKETDVGAIFNFGAEEISLDEDTEPLLTAPIVETTTTTVSRSEVKVVCPFCDGTDITRIK